MFFYTVPPVIYTGVVGGVPRHIAILYFNHGTYNVYAKCILLYTIND
jgi:hypothetical protein